MANDMDRMSLKELSERTIEDCTRWIAEITRRGEIRSTLWYGIMQKCIHHVERTIQECAEALLKLTGEKGRVAVRDVASGKRLERFTMGQQIVLLKRLAQILDKESSADQRLMDPKTNDLLDHLVEARNEFVHTPPCIDDVGLILKRFLGNSVDLCRSRLVEAAIAVQEKKSPE